MDIVIIEDLKIISQSVICDFEKVSNKTLSITSLESIEQVKNFDFSQTKFIVSDLFLGSTIYETLFELYQIKLAYYNVKVSIYTQSADIPHLESILSLINASHLFDKRFVSSIADTVLHSPCQSFTATKNELDKARAILSMRTNNQQILQNLAQYTSLTTIALEANKSKSAISQALRKIETSLGAKRHLLKLFMT